MLQTDGIVDKSFELKEFVKLDQNRFLMSAIKSLLKAQIRVSIRRIKFRGSIIFENIIFSKDKRVRKVIVIEWLCDSGSYWHFGSISGRDLLVFI